MDFKFFNKIPAGTVIRTVSTRFYPFPTPANFGSIAYVRVRQVKILVKFIVFKGFDSDWSIYYGPAAVDETSILNYGAKLIDMDHVLEIFPCAKEVADRYRK